MDSFFWIAGPSFDRNLLLYGEHDPWMVLLSVFVAMFASTMAMQAAVQARNIPQERLRNTTLLAGSLALGCGVWAMHFIGMLAFRLCTQVSYDTGLTSLSVLPSMGASWIALRLLSQERVSLREFVIAGVLMGAGIGAMHYAGMAAMRMAPVLRYDPWMFALSIVVAVALSVLALWVRFGLATTRLRFISQQGKTTQTLLAGAVMGLAIAGMHYTGMAAARFVGRPTAEFDLAPANQVPLALSITLVTLVISVLVAAAIGLARYRRLLEVNLAKESRLRAIADTSIDGIIVFDKHGVIHEFNSGATRIFGRPSAGMIGQSVAQIMVEPYRSQASADFPAFLASMGSLMGTTQSTHCFHTDGRCIPIRLVIGRTARQEEEMYVAFVADVSEQQRMERAVRDSEAQFRSLISNIPGVSYRCCMEPGWPMVFVSDAIERLTGWPASAFLGPHAEVRLSDLVPADEVARISQIVKNATQADQQFVLEFQMRTRGGTVRWMWGNGRIVRASDHNVRWIDGVLLDITERRQMEEDLMQAKERAEAAAQARSTFLANMSHEIRTPMNAILGFTEVVLDGELQSAQRKHLETVHKSARSLLHLLNDILDTSKLDRGALELEMLDFSLHDLVQQLCAEQSIQAGRKSLVLRNDMADSVGDMVQGDPHRLRQILLNLLGNAIKFTEHGEVVLAGSRQGHSVYFTVTDTGIGIAPERLDTIFEAFTQADASMSRRFGGTGLGTTISKQLTELMGGRIWVTSTVGEGSTFHVTLPLPLSQVQRTEGRRPQGAVHLPPLHMLVVDDVPQNTDLLKVVLGRQGHTLTVASNGQEAVDRFGEQVFDVVLMDVQMPVMDGLSACRAIRQLESQRGRGRTPVIALSASVQEEDRQAAMDAGMDGFAHKPLNLPDLALEISRVTGVAPIPAPQPPTSDDAASTTQPDTPLFVDLQQGLERWGELAPYHQALRRFAQEQERWLEAAEHQQAPDTLAQAQATAHRLQGAAANLGLSALTQAAQQVEAADEHTPFTQRGQAWLQLRKTLRSTLVALQDLMPAELQTPEPAAPLSTTVDPALAQLWLHQAQRLRPAFQRGESLEPLFTQFCDSVRAHPSTEARQALRALEQANEDFDFERAVLVLDQLTPHLTASRSEHAVL